MNSPLVDYTLLSSNHSGKRTQPIDTITPHCFVGQITTEKGLEYFKNTAKYSSCNYLIGTDGSLGLCVDEDCRSWCTSSFVNDQRAVTIECASDIKAPYKMNKYVYNTLVDLCVDICKRNGKVKLIWLKNLSKTRNHILKDDEMIITVHRWFANKECPGDWLYKRLPKMAKTVTKRLKKGR